MFKYALANRGGVLQLAPFCRYTFYKAIKPSTLPLRLVQNWSETLPEARDLFANRSSEILIHSYPGATLSSPSLAPVEN